MTITGLSKTLRTLFVGVFTGLFFGVVVYDLLDVPCYDSDIIHRTDSLRREVRMREDTIIKLDLRIYQLEVKYRKDTAELNRKLKDYEGKIDSVYNYTPTELDSFFRSRYGY